MTCSRSHDKSRLDSVLVCLDCTEEDAKLLKRLAEALAEIAENHSEGIMDMKTMRGSGRCWICGVEPPCPTRQMADAALAAARAQGVIGEEK